jgi:hypothetical protein
VAIAAHRYGAIIVAHRRVAARVACLTRGHVAISIPAILIRAIRIAGGRVLGSIVGVTRSAAITLFTRIDEPIATAPRRTIETACIAGSITVHGSFITVLSSCIEIAVSALDHCAVAITVRRIGRCAVEGIRTRVFTTITSFSIDAILDTVAAMRIQAVLAASIGSGIAVARPIVTLLARARPRGHRQMIVMPIPAYRQGAVVVAMGGIFAKCVALFWT